LTAQITGMSQGVRTANDGISLAQTAEGALNEVTNMLQRVRELAVQSKSATYQQSDRDAMQSEVGNLNAQISDVLNNTKFTGN
ncbi:flagellin, partial [Acinetobacter baumannii]